MRRTVRDELLFQILLRAPYDEKNWKLTISEKNSPRVCGFFYKKATEKFYLLNDKNVKFGKNPFDQKHWLIFLELKLHVNLP